MLDSAYEIRHGHTTKEEGKALIQKFDGEYPVKYEREFYEYISSLIVIFDILQISLKNSLKNFEKKPPFFYS